MADTSKDVRILAAERLVSRLANMVQQRAYGSAKQTAAAKQILEGLTGKVAALRYSYQEDDALAQAEDTRAVAEGGRKVVENLEKNPDLSGERLAFLEFAGAVLSHLPEAFRLKRSLESAVPVEVGRVLSAERPPKAKNLLLCRVEVFGGSFQLVTNLTNTRPGDLMKVARVPPSEIMGLLSAAQFVGRADPAAAPGERPELTADEEQEIRRAMGRLLDG